MIGPQPNRDLYQTPKRSSRTNYSISRLQLEKSILSELGLSANIQNMGLGEVSYLQDYLSSRMQFPLPSNLVETTIARGYDWRKESSLECDPHTALYLDTIARLNEISNQASKNDVRTSVPNLKSILGRMS